ncbi:hypothetical protein ABPG72_008639 [Tetrahymena utriculariae]
MEGNFQATLPLKKSTNQNEKKGLFDDQKGTFNSTNNVSISNTTWQNRRIFLHKFFKGFDDNVEELMRAILKVQNDIQKLLASSFKTEPKESQKSSQFENMVELVCTDLKFITLQAKIFESQMNEYQTRLNNCVQNDFAKENILTELNEINYLNDIQKAIFDNYFDPRTQQLQGSNHESVKNCSNPNDISANKNQLNYKQRSQVNNDQIFQDTITPYSNSMGQQSRFKSINETKRIENDYLNSLETPTDQGNAEDIREINPKEKENDSLQQNKNSIEPEKIIRQFKKRYPVEQKIEIVKEITSKTFYQQKKIIPKMFLAKYQICYQTLQNWIKKYHDKQHE